VYRISANSNRIVEAYKAASIYNWIVDCDNKYDATVRERGIKLLNSKRQRIAIASAILKKAKILLLNKATSTIDNLTKVSFYKSLKSEIQY